MGLLSWLFGIKPITFEGGSGETPETAVVIRGATGSFRGVAAEYSYLEKRFGRRGVDWDLVQQSLVDGSDGKHFDLFTVSLKDKGQVEVYIDISEFFGRI
jgi:hypothetical protein